MPGLVVGALETVNKRQGSALMGTLCQWGQKTLQ